MLCRARAQGARWSQGSPAIDAHLHKSASWSPHQDFGLSVLCSECRFELQGVLIRTCVCCFCVGIFTSSPKESCPCCTHTGTKELGGLCLHGISAVRRSLLLGSLCRSLHYIQTTCERTTQDDTNIYNLWFARASTPVK